MSEKTIYVGQGWESKFGLKISINKSKLSEGIASGEIEVNQYGDIKMEVVKRKAIDPKSKATHFVKIDNYKPENKGNNWEKAAEKAPSDSIDDLPF